VILRHGRPPTRIIRMLQSGIHGMQRGYVGVVARMACAKGITTEGTRNQGTTVAVMRIIDLLPT
jgi:hypothetical protein